jgi:hypothetical protein
MRRMRSRRRWLALGVPAALAALVVGAALAGAAPAATARHANVTAAAAPHVNGLVHIVHRGLVKDCEYIEVNNGGTPLGLYITGNGVNVPVTIEPDPSSDQGRTCFDLYNSFTITIISPFTNQDVKATGYQYQNLNGRCLWQNDTTGKLEVGAPCNATDTSEDFYAIPGSYALYGGWQWTDEFESPATSPPSYPEGYFGVVAVGGACNAGADVVPNGSCGLWNFPQG